jgi:hypothetical protein
MLTILDAISDKNIFGGLFKDINTWQNWIIFLKSVFALPMDEAELAIYQEFTGRENAPLNPMKEVFAVVGRRGGKSFISSIIACYLALFYDWRPYLSPGEMGWIMCIASDRQQARVIFGYIRAVTRLKMFQNSIEKELNEEIRLKNGIIISVKTCDYRSLRGFTVVAAICDEVAFWRSEGANPAEEILTAIRPALATVPGSMLLGISTPYAKSGPLYEAFRDRYGKDDPDVLVWKAASKVMNITLSDRIIDKALKDDYSAGRAEWLAEFREDLETFLPTEIIESAIIRNRWELPKIEGVQYHAFLDPSGGRSDSFTLGIAHKEQGSNKILLDRIEERRAPFNPQAVAKEFSEIIKKYGISRAKGDKYAGEWVARAFRDEGITFEASDLSKSEIYLESEPLLAQGAVELLDHQRLFNQLRSLERRTRSGGRDSVDHGPNLQDDVSNAACGAIVLASQGRPERRIYWV